MKYLKLIDLDTILNLVYFNIYLYRKKKKDLLYEVYL